MARLSIRTKRLAYIPPIAPKGMIKAKLNTILATIPAMAQLRVSSASPLAFIKLTYMEVMPRINATAIERGSIISMGK